MIRDFVQLLYPNLCPSCRIPLVKGEQEICTKCFLELSVMRNNGNANDVMLEKFKGKALIYDSYTLLNYHKGSKVQNLLHQIKYKEHIRLGVFLGKLLGEQMRNSGPVYDYIVPIPLHPKKLRKRGFNQSEIISDGVGAVLQKPVNNVILERFLFTETQTKKSKIERWRNVQNIFRKHKASPDLKDKHVLLVDDVLTTGATMESAIHVLYRKGAKKVSIACLALAE